jgi:hypothetical protein
MKRRHAIEFEDFAWFPKVLWDGATAYLHIIGSTSGVDKLFLPFMKKILNTTQDRRIVDLCSGAGGPLPSIVETLEQEGIAAQVTLTDLYPNVPQLSALTSASSSVLSYTEHSVDATDVNIPGVRTLFNAFHHFKPAQAAGIIADAVKKKQAIGIFEIVERKPGAFLSVIVAALGVFLLMPWIKPRKPSWLFFTYVLPLIPLLVLWDGIASCLRVYSPQELNHIINKTPDHNSFHWEVSQQRLPYLIARATIVIGYPKLCT